MVTIKRLIGAGVSSLTERESIIQRQNLVEYFLRFALAMFIGGRGWLILHLEQKLGDVRSTGHHHQPVPRSRQNAQRLDVPSEVAHYQHGARWD